MKEADGDFSGNPKDIQKPVETIDVLGIKFRKSDYDGIHSLYPDWNDGQIKGYMLKCLHNMETMRCMKQSNDHFKQSCKAMREFF